VSARINRLLISPNNILFPSFFYDLTESPIFEIMCFCQYVGTYFVVILVVAYDGIFFEIGSVIVGNLIKLQVDLQKCIAKRDENCVKKLVDEHNQIVECFEKFKMIFGPVILNKFLISAISICMLGFQIVAVRFEKKVSQHSNLMIF
jgi:hypothetical protein